jgi:uncharacterized protein YbjT (DUF2867 family)
VVIDVSNRQTISKRRSIAFFGAATSSLLAAEERAGVTHHVALSVVGSDRVGLGYYFGKRRQEHLVLSGRIPATVLRATQFHEFAAQLLARGRPFTLVPEMLSQPVAAREVADGQQTFDQWLATDGIAGPAQAVGASRIEPGRT